MLCLLWLLEICCEDSVLTLSPGSLFVDQAPWINIISMSIGFTG